MSSLAFLHADVGVGAPAARSPMAREAGAAGARLQTRDGWEVAYAYCEREVELRACRETVAFADLSHLGTLELQGDPEACAAALRRAGAAAHSEAPGAGPLLGAGHELGAGPRLGEAMRAQEAWWCPLTPRRLHVICEPAATAALRCALESSFDGHVLDVTAAFAALAIVGPLAREVFARFCALDLRRAQAPVGALRPGSAGRTPACVLREGDARYLLVFGAAYGSYMWEVVSDAVARQGGRAVGLDALAEATAGASGAGRAHA